MRITFNHNYFLKHQHPLLHNRSSSILGEEIHLQPSRACQAPGKSDQKIVPEQFIFHGGFDVKITRKQISNRNLTSSQERFGRFGNN